MSIFACKTFLLVLCCNQEPLMLEETCKEKVWSFGGGGGVEYHGYMEHAWGT
jgi:hypothetical protein